MRKHCFLITGAAGFIGSHFVKTLLDKGVASQRIIMLDKLTYASDLKRLNGLDVQLIQGDITDDALLWEILKTHQISCIVNFAAESHVDNSILSLDNFVHTNVIGVQKLLEVSQAFWKNNGADLELAPRFIQISTDEVYGSSVASDTTVFTEKSPMTPKNPYAATKASAEMLIGAYMNTYDYPGMIVRSSNNYGQGQHEEKLIPKALKAISENKPIPLYGNGQQRRTWLHVRDNCEAIYRIIEDGRLHEIYNVVGREDMSNKDLLEMMIQLNEAIKDTPYQGKIERVEDRPGHDYFYRVSGEKIKKELKVFAKTSLREGLIELISLKKEDA